MSNKTNWQPATARIALERGVSRAIKNWPTWTTCGLIMLLLSASAPWVGVAHGQQENDRVQESLTHWQTFAPITLPETKDSALVDFILTPEIFQQANYDLSDLRLYDQQGGEVPYALRVLNKKTEERLVPVRLFNRTEDASGTSEVSLELEDAIVEHNELRVQLPGRDYRRQVELEGSDDGTNWRPLITQYLVDFTRGGHSLRDNAITYPPSRYRFLRLRVGRDPVVDRATVSIQDVSVVRRIDLPGEELVGTGKLDQRQAVPTRDGPGSSWVVDLGGDQVPVSRLEVSVADGEFVRNYMIEAGGPAGSGDFYVVSSGIWRRRQGEPQRPLAATFSETRAARLRITVTDNRNAPLQLEQVTYSAAARQVVFAPTDGMNTLNLYAGNADARQPGYDFARNLPEKLNPAPARAVVGHSMPNPAYTPVPPPLTERWPWLIYTVLSAASLVLLGILLSLSRTVIARHDAELA